MYHFNSELNLNSSMDWIMFSSFGMGKEKYCTFKIQLGFQT
jgi:hypothetical protein